MDHLYGGYVKLGAPIGENLRPYVIGGYTKVKGKVSANGTVAGVDYSYSDTETFEDESYGAGLDFNITDTFGANLEYMRYVDTDEEEISGYQCWPAFRVLIAGSQTTSYKNAPPEGLFCGDEASVVRGRPRAQRR